ncbi:hypothetical protein BO82DRAFT_144755 [Aspergillus uvarum CBS 121591]|uniref:Uncharacterized protein n=1 Tax=Aspergillus uvarum CBS 121591 TaxID=1448315 RepID=A0A319DD16_9EURO|nr:hypothetical protein BO82DRAFT_144755 [Aspergillus uvarum CBS 121591]PYH86028.1 hypothetical protein BO82DRAFT_144755 [Aspergillus uvarum CBS 121591]
MRNRSLTVNKQWVGGTRKVEKRVRKRAVQRALGADGRRRRERQRQSETARARAREGESAEKKARGAEPVERKGSLVETRKGSAVTYVPDLYEDATDGTTRYSFLHSSP